MRFIRSAATTLALAGAATLAVSAGPAFAGAPIINVTPSVAVPGASVTFTIYCGKGANGATLYGTALSLSSQIPMERSLGRSGAFVVTVVLPTAIVPGGYSPSLDCSNGPAGTAYLTVNPVPATPTPLPTPTGAPVTGDGTTSSTMGGPFMAAGLTLLAAGGLAVGAGILRKRRWASARS